MFPQMRTLTSKYNNTIFLVTHALYYNATIFAFGFVLNKEIIIKKVRKRSICLYLLTTEGWLVFLAHREQVGVRVRGRSVANQDLRTFKFGDPDWPPSGTPKAGYLDTEPGHPVGRGFWLAVAANYIERLQLPSL